MSDRLVVRGSVQCALACLGPPFNGSLAELRPREMVGDNLRLELGDCREPITQGLGDASVQHLPTALEHVLVSRVLDQRVLETIHGFWRVTAAEQNLRGLKL